MKKSEVEERELENMLLCHETLKQTSKSGGDLYLHQPWLTSDFYMKETVTVAKWLTLPRQVLWKNSLNLWITIVSPTDEALIALVQHFIFFPNSLR